MQGSEDASHIGQGPKSENPEDKSMFKKFFNAGAWTAIFTGVLTVFTGLLFVVADRTNETAKETQRAFLNFAGISGGAGLTSPDGKTKIGQEVRLNWSNSGTTPAKNAIANISGEPWPSTSELPQGFDFKDLSRTDRRPFVVGPKEISGIRAPIPLGALRSTREGRTRLFFWGWVVYDDTFPDDPPRLTEFCTEMIQITVLQGKDISDLNSPIGWNLQSCREHNCYDKDCKDYSDRVKDARGI